MNDAYICDAARTPIGRYGGVLSSMRTDDLGALPIKELLKRNPKMDAARIDDVIYGCANQAGEDNRNVARMSALIARLPEAVAGVTLNRLCASGLNAVAMGAALIKLGEAELIIAGGVESMSRAPLVMGKAETAFSRHTKIYDTTLGWRFVNPLMRKHYGVDSMAETADNVAREHAIGREDQDKFALRSQQRWAKSQQQQHFADELMQVEVSKPRGQSDTVDTDEHPRPDTTLEKLGALKGINGPELSVTAGNSSGINDGACALVLASEGAAKSHGLTPRARVLAAAASGVAPRVMGIGPIPASHNALTRSGLKIGQMDVIELNEAFAAQALAVIRAWGMDDDSPHINAQGGAIAMGHPLGMSGARLVGTALYQLQRSKGRYALCTMCVGVGQGFAMVMERV